MPPIQAIIPVTPGSGLDLDAVSLTIGLNTVYRETMVIADPSNATQLAGVTVGGALQVDASATTQPIIGTLTSNNAAPDGHNIGVLPAVANASHPTYTEGDIVLLSTDLTGALRVSITGTILATNNIEQWNSVALGSPTAFGTEPSGNVIGVNAEVFQGSSVVGAGNALYVQFPSAQAVTQSTSPWIVAGGGTAGTAATGVLTVQGIAAMTPLLVTATFSAPQHVIVDSGTLTTVSTVTAVTSITNPVAVTGTFFQATQPVSIASGQVASGAFASGSIASGAIASGAIASGAIAAGAAAAGAFADGSVFVRSNAAATFPVTATIAASQTIAVTQATAASLNATVVPGGSAIFEVSPTTAANTKTNPFFNQIADGTNAAVLGAFGTAPATSIYALAVEAALVANVTGTPTALTATGTSLNVNITGGSSGNAAASATGSAVPASADYQGLNVGGTLRGWTGVNPSGSIYAAQIDVASVLGATLSKTNPLFTEISDGTNTVTTNSTTYTSKYGLDVNLLGTLGTAFTTAGFIDIKGADGNVFVRQATASNLNAAVVGTKTNNNAAPGATNVGVLPAVANAAAQSWTEGDQVALSVDLSGHQRVVATGGAAVGAAAVGNPVLIGGISAGNVQSITVNNGALVVAIQQVPIDGQTNQCSSLETFSGTGNPEQIFPFVYNGTTWDRKRSATIGNAVAATGIAASAAYGEYLSTAPAPTTGQYSALQTDNAGSLFVKNTRRSQTAAQGTTISSTTTATAVTATPAAATFADLSQLIITVTPIAVTAIAFTATLSDGTNTYIYDLDTGVTASGGGDLLVVNFNPPLPATSAATGWTIALSVNTVVAHITTVVVLQKAS